MFEHSSFYHVFVNKWPVRLLTLCLSLLLFTDRPAMAELEMPAPLPDKVTIALNVDNPPLKFKNDQGRADGILIDIWRLWSKKSGIEVEFKEALFADTIEMLTSGEADIHAGLFFTTERDQFLDYSEPLIDIKYYAYHHKSVSGINLLEDMTPFRIGVPKGYTHSFLQQNLPEAVTNLYENFPKLYDAALAGDIVVFVSPPMTLEYYLRTKQRVNPFRYNPANPVYQRTYLGAVREGNINLLDAINRGMAQISDEERVQIERNWLKKENADDGKKTFIVACDSDFAPISMLNARGEPAGLLIDIWKMWAKKEGVEVKFLFDTWEGSIQAVQEGLADFHSGLESKEPWATSSHTFYQLTTKLFYPQDRGVQSLKDLAGQTVATIDPYYATLLQDISPSIEVVVVKDYAELFTRLSQDEVVAFIDAEIAFEDVLLRQGRQGEFATINDFFHTSKLSAITNKNNSSLLKQINRGLQYITIEDYQKLERKWLRTPDTGHYHQLERQVILTEEEQQWLKAHPVLRLGVDPAYAPFESIDSQGHHIGMAADYMQLIEKKLGNTLQVEKNLSWQQVMDRSRNKTIDVLSCVVKTPERSHYLTFTNPYISYPIVIATRGNYPQLGGIKDLDGVKVALVKDYPYTEMALRQGPKIKPVYVDTIQQGLEAVLMNKADAIICDLASMAYLTQHYNLVNLKVNARTKFTNPGLSLAVRDDYPLLVSILNKTLASFTRAEHQRIQQRWVGIDFSPDTTPEIKLTDGEKRWLAAHPTIRIGVDPSYAPYAFVDEQGVFKGVAADYAEVISRMLGVRMEMVPNLSWPQILDGARNKTVDVVTTAAHRAEREAYLAFSQGYIPTPLVIMSRSDNTTIQSRDDLQGKTVALVTEYSSSKQVMEEFPDIKMVAVASPLQGLQLVSTGQADAYVGVLGINVFQANTHGIANLKVAAPYDMQTNFQRYGIRKDWPELVTILDKALDAIPDKQKFHILNKWIPLNEERPLQVLLNLTDEEQAFIDSHPVIRLGVDPEFIPFEYISEDGSYSGLASDYIKILNKRLGLNMKVVPRLSWAEAIERSKNKEIDALPCVGKTKERLSYLNYSKPYIKFQRVIITRSDFPFIAGMDDLQDLKVAVQADTSHDGFLQDTTEIEAIRFPTLQKALTAVSTGKADAFVGNIAASSYWIRHLNLTNLKVAAPAQSETLDLHFAVRKDWPELVSLIDKGLASINEVEKNTIFQKWVSVNYEPGIATKKVIGYILRIVGGAVVLLLLVLLWSYRLKREVAQRKEAEEKMAHYAHELEQANVHLQSLDKLKSMFIASMSHELRTPLNSIIGFTGVILQGMTGEINERQHDQLSRVYRSAKHLLSLISDVIDISKVEAGRIEVFPEQCSLKEITDEAIENIQPQLRGKNLSLEVKVAKDLQIITDRKRLLQCLINYLSNGVKFTEEGGILFTVQERDDKVEITVTDTGIGIAEEDIPKLFEAFERLETHLRVKAGGTGLGLYLTKKIVTEVLEGDIWVESAASKGSTFGIRIPKVLSNPIQELSDEHASSDH